MGSPGEREPGQVRRQTNPVRAVAYRDGRRSARPDEVVTEEPLEVRLAGPGQEPIPVAVTMRTPGHDFELAAGFLYSESLVGPGAIAAIGYCDVPDPAQRLNVVTVRLARRVDPESVSPRRDISASCGLCGKASIDQLEAQLQAAGRDALVPGPCVGPDLIAALPGLLSQRQQVFGRTGGLHAAGLFSSDGAVLAVREDVGRHNAVDKLVGWALLRGDLPLSGALLMVSGRVSFEIVQKAALAGIPLLAAVSAPSSLAVDTAVRLGMTLVGFVRDGNFNLYAGPERVWARA